MTSEFGALNTDADDGFVGRMRIAAQYAGNATRLAEATGISRRAIAEYLAGKSDPNRSRLIAIAKAAGVSVEWLATGRLAVPVVGLAACGLEGWYQERRLSLTAEAPDGASPRCFAVIATGESMIPENINPGDTVIVDGSKDAVYGQIALVELKDGSASIKRFLGYDGDWAALEGWLPPEDGHQRLYMDRRRRDQINRIMPMVVVQPGLPGLDQAAAQTAPRVEAGPEIDRVLELVPAAVSETMRFIDYAKLEADPEPTGDLCGISMRLMLAPELDGAPVADKQTAVRRHLEAFLPMLKRPLWRRLLG